MNTSNFPNFIIFGSNKSGSTSLCNYIVQHFDVFMSKKKEPNFFLYDEGEVYSNRLGQKQTNSLVNYQSLFKKACNYKAVGEGSVSYIADQKAPYRIKNLIPDVKLIALLRNPVSRAYSQYLFMKKNKFEESKNFAEALELDLQRTYPHRYFEKGQYYQHLKTYYDIFSKEQIKIYIFEDFTANPLEITQDLFRFLEVRDDFIPNTTTKDAVSGIPKNQVVYNFIHQDNPIKQMIRPLIKPFLSKDKRRELWTKAIELSLKKPPMDQESKILLKEKYSSDILQLQDLIDRDLSLWLK